MLTLNRDSVRHAEYPDSVTLPKHLIGNQVIYALLQEPSLDPDLQQVVDENKNKNKNILQVKLLHKAFIKTGHHRCVSHAPTPAHS